MTSAVGLVGGGDTASHADTISTGAGPQLIGWAANHIAELRLIVAFPVAMFAVGIASAVLLPLAHGYWSSNIGHGLRGAHEYSGVARLATRMAWGASPEALLFAVPTYLMFRARGVTRPAAFAIAGIVIAGVLVLLDYGVAYTFDLKFPINIRPTFAGLAADLMSWIPAGFVGGLVLWAIDPTTPNAQTDSHSSPQ